MSPQTLDFLLQSTSCWKTSSLCSSQCLNLLLNVYNFHIIVLLLYFAFQSFYCQLALLPCPSSCLHRHMYLHSPPPLPSDPHPSSLLFSLCIPDPSVLTLYSLAVISLSLLPPCLGMLRQTVAEEEALCHDGNKENKVKFLQTVGVMMAAP